MEQSPSWKGNSHSVI